MANVISPVGKAISASSFSLCLAWISRVRNAGSFIRPSANVSYGKSFLEALTSKYIETLHGSESQEKVLLGSSQGAIVVEAVRLDKIRGKLASLDRLREVSLDNENPARSDPVGAIQAACPSKCRC
jgi:tubulin-specific chaperone E